MVKVKINEKWSKKYKRSIDCNHPKGFSQKAHCRGRKKQESIQEIDIRLSTADQRKEDYEFDKNVPKKFIGNYKGYKVYNVDGNYIRNNIDIDFVGGGNPSRYQYVPEKEIWIEKLSDNKKSDIMGFIKHEYIECERMKNKGESYEDAHDKASAAEKKIRAKISKEV